MRRRAAGLLLFVLLLLAAVPGVLLLPLLILFGPERWAKDALRALDHLGNATIFRGNPYESISSHVGRLVLAGSPPWWARLLDRGLSLLQPGHCVGAALAEAPVLEAIRRAKP